MNRISNTKQNETVLFVVPAYNEAAEIRNFINSWTPVVKSIPGSEVLIVNDGSTDNTLEILSELKKKYRFLKVADKTNEGHGKTIRLGYESVIKSKHKWVFQTDSDGHFQPSDFYKLWEKRNTSPFILGHREKRDDTIFRKTLSKIIKIWIKLLLDLDIHDANIPFRLMKTSYLKTLLPKIKHDVFAPNIHLSILAAKDKNNLHHVCVEHTNGNKKNNNISILKGAFIGFFELLMFSVGPI